MNEKLKNKIKEADAILITAGAGMGVKVSFTGLKLYVIIIIN